MLKLRTVVGGRRICSIEHKESHPKMKLDGKPRLLGVVIYVSHYNFGMGGHTIQYISF